jgi:hypothetical protein
MSIIFDYASDVPELQVIAVPLRRVPTEVARLRAAHQMSTIAIMSEFATEQSRSDCDRSNSLFLGL